MIEKIISGGQTGADRAALDTAIEIGINHGGWVPRGRKTEDGRLPPKYHVQETNSIDYAQRTEFNILDSDGTLIISHGDLKGGSELTQKLARKHHRSCLHIDLNTINEYRAVEIIQSWIDSKDIRVLNVAGPRISEDPNIYEDVQNVLRSLLYPPPEFIASSCPSTIMEAVHIINESLSLREKSMIAKIGESDNPNLHKLLGGYIKDKLELQSLEDRLLESSRYTRKKNGINEYDVSSMIIRELWKRLRKSHRLRPVK